MNTLQTASYGVFSSDRGYLYGLLYVRLCLLTRAYNESLKCDSGVRRLVSHNQNTGTTFPNFVFRLDEFYVCTQNMQK